MGVKAAVEKARMALSSGRAVWCLHELVHNETVIDELRANGMRFVESPDDVPQGETVLFSAHGVPPAVRQKAEARGLGVIDTTCPFVARAHRQVRSCAGKGMPVVIVGHAEHVEVAGLVGEYRDARNGAYVAVVKDVGDVRSLPFAEKDEVCVVCQTTLSSELVDRVLETLRARYPRLLETPASETCTATRDRQRAVREFVMADGRPDRAGVLVLGGARSSNTLRLAETAVSAGAKAWRISGPEEFASCDFSGIERLGLTAGASTPEPVVDAVYRLAAELQSGRVRAKMNDRF